MAPRPYWKGYLKLSLVTCAVTLSVSTPSTARPVIASAPKAEDDYLILEEDELNSVQLESARTVDNTYSLNLRPVTPPMTPLR